MQKVRIVYKDGDEVILTDTAVSVLLTEQKLAIQNPNFLDQWTYIPLKDIKAVATWKE